MWGITGMKLIQKKDKKKGYEKVDCIAGVHPTVLQERLTPPNLQLPHPTNWSVENEKR